MVTSILDAQRTLLSRDRAEPEGPRKLVAVVRPLSSPRRGLGRRADRQTGSQHRGYTALGPREGGRL
jgi:hypothetical protein